MTPLTILTLTVFAAFVIISAIEQLQRRRQERNRRQLFQDELSKLTEHPAGAISDVTVELFDDGVLFTGRETLRVSDSHFINRGGYNVPRNVGFGQLALTQDGGFHVPPGAQGEIHHQETPPGWDPDPE